ncbi:N-acetylglucosaminyl-phosphatidylinositol biosynthetic protein [Physcia stellaris]|nr:N-acetylglucosaminyl-phosphatidylinositol biosynthetic protein [Physcia stellaris]
MVANNGLLRIFWPSDVPRDKKQGTIVGWKNSDLDIFVVSILQGVEPRKVENAFKVGTLFRNSPHPIQQILHLCNTSSMHVLGIVNPSVSPQGFDPKLIVAYTEPSSPFPQVASPSDGVITVQIIIFERPSPRRMQYLSLNPISLVLGDKFLVDESVFSIFDSEGVETENAREQRQRLIDKLQLHTVVRHPPSKKETLLPIILNQVNCSWEVAQLLDNNQYLLGPRQKRSLSMGERVVESATTLWDFIIESIWHVLTVWLYPLLTRAFVTGLICHRFVAEIVLRVLEWRPGPEAAALKDVSATAQQVDIRLQQFCYWPIQYLTLRKRKTDWESITDRHPDYIRFYNSLWLVANDVIIGIALGSYIIDNADWVAWQINYVLSGWTVEGLQSMIEWLMDWPAGLKLNNELARFLGDLFLWVIEYWAECVANLRPYLPQVIYFIGFSSFAGATMPISLFSDLLSLLTVHIYCFYTASARIFHWQLTIIVSLFHLFRGKKHNVLRNRIDSCDYDLDQLLLGTILFTLLFFLLPTILVFYITFTSARLAIISLKAALDTLLACLNHFPLFALMLRVKDSRRLPGGIRFELQDAPSFATSSVIFDSTPPTSYIMLQVKCADPVT